ncbi:patatin-like phospholipase family protein [Luteibacter yeojuensis]
MKGKGREQDVFVAFQGGGAKGIAHVGAYQAIWDIVQRQPTEGVTFNIRGVAGTSAGAIIAALVAAKVEPSRLFDATRNTHLLQKIANGAYKKPTRLFTRMGWARLWAVRFVTKHRWLRMTLLSLIVVIVIFWIWPLEASVWIACKVTVAVLAAVAALAMRHYSNGLAPLRNVRALVNEVMAEFVGESPIAPVPKRWWRPRKKFRDITFTRLREANGYPLKIVATDLTTRNVQVFSYEKTPLIAVADAVCASICLPFVFSPFLVQMSEEKSHRFMDGGALSNLPLWVFDNDRSDSPSAWTIGISMKRVLRPEPAHRSSPPTPWLPPLMQAWQTRLVANVRGFKRASGVVSSDSAEAGIGALVDAIVGGPLEIHARAVDDLLLIRLPVWLNVLEFDAKFETFGKQIADAREETEQLLQNIDAAASLEVMLETLRSEFALKLGLLAKDWGTSEPAAQLTAEDFRMAIFQTRQRSTDTLWMCAASGYASNYARSTPGVPLAASFPGGISTSRKPRSARIDGSRFVSGKDETWLPPDAKWVLGMLLPNFMGGAGDSADLSQAVLTIESGTLTEACLGTNLGENEHILEQFFYFAQEWVKEFNRLNSEFGQFAEVMQLWH